MILLQMAVILFLVCKALPVDAHLKLGANHSAADAERQNSK
jgi:hypothetical protein